MGDVAKIGMHVMYGKTGVCLVKEKITMSGGQYYVLLPVGDSRSSVYVPCANADLLARMHPLLTREEIDSLLTDVDTVQVPWVEDRNARAMLYRSITGGGDRKELVRLLACLMRKKQERIAIGKRLSSMDENFLQECVRLVQEEFSMVLGITANEVGPYIQARL